MTRKLFYNGTIITGNTNNEVLTNGAIGVEGEKIIYVGTTPDDVASYDERIDLKGNILLPGLVNTHGHTPMSLLRGYADDLHLQTWLEDKIWPLEAQYTPEHAKWGAKLSILEMIRTGTTTFVDMYDNMDEIAKAVEEAGIRGVLCRGIIGFGSEELRQSKLKEAADFAKSWNNGANGRITTMLSPHSPYTCSPEYITQIIDKAVELNVPLHTHMSETKFEVEKNIEEYGATPVRHLEKLGFFDRPSLVAHAVHVNEEDIQILAEKDVKVSHNIISNLKLGSGIAPVGKMLERGVTVSLGTDSVASNNNLDLFEELKAAATVHKGLAQDATVITAQQALRMATINGAESLWLEEQIGSLEAGKDADFIVVNSNQSFFYPKNNPVSHLVYSGSGRDVKDVYVQGKQILDNGQFKTIDEEKVLYEANRMSKLLS
ncbi:amidohydrolase family protein [Mesobacillus selenatarsenatis]|uniref:5-methylthioadenosine/S-adenosylhomocysteine deaminase n=1 Tax=Mesobacillus selenatarsenatis TaxID=388741 RepID=A0A846TM83_9BACI|nr:amidohydrolase [Mesobacillus selenatarsenatis]NKE05195.1 amidohydrolase [Mesobacillus selenatarsenatis]